MNTEEFKFEEEKDILSDFELSLLKEAFNKIDLVVDRETKSGGLISLWSFMSDFIEFNEEKNLNLNNKKEELINKEEVSGMSESEKQKEILQLGINSISTKIVDKENLIKNHPKEDKDFIKQLEEQLTRWRELYDFAVKWRNSIN